MLVFADALETDKPNVNDPNVIYYGPGLHEIGDKVIAVRAFGEFETLFDGKIIEFYGKDSVVVRTKSGHDWIFNKSDVRENKS